MNSGAGVPGVVGADAAVGVLVSDSPESFFILAEEVFNKKKRQIYRRSNSGYETKYYMIFEFMERQFFFCLFFFLRILKDESLELHNLKAFISVFLRNRWRERTQIYDFEIRKNIRMMC